MISLLTRVALTLILLGSLSMPAPCQDVPKEIRDKMDSAIAEAYRTAATGLPCKIKTRGKADMLRWEDVDRCLNHAAGLVDWDALSRQLQELKTSTYGVSDSGFSAALEASLSAHALTYDKVFIVKNPKARLCLTNSVLKFLPADSLQDLPVFDKTGFQVGMFSGVYTYERGGGLVAVNPYRLTLFQYTDRNGNVTKYTYDGLNRRTFAGFGYNGSTYQDTIGYTWDGGNRLTQAVDSTAGTIARSGACPEPPLRRPERSERGL